MMIDRNHCIKYLNRIQMDIEFLEIPVIFHAILVKIFTFEQEK